MTMRREKREKLERGSEFSPIWSGPVRSGGAPAPRTICARAARTSRSARRALPRSLSPPFELTSALRTKSRELERLGQRYAICRLETLRILHTAYHVAARIEANHVALAARRLQPKERVVVCLLCCTALIAWSAKHTNVVSC